jgi:ABC-type polysaccharide/polyol phosphate transport system ATPase subunit
MALIEVAHVTKQFRSRQGKRILIGRGGIADMLRGKGRDMFTALNDISLTVDAGESLGIIGSNGSGKSTLLKILAGVTLPTTGDVTVRGRVASLLELGAGFHPMLTGRENVYLNAGILGMRHAQVDEVFDQIVAFSGIGAFIDNPVDTYSSGMYVRIAFAVAVHVNPDIFLVDEVLSVGDEEFQRKCRTIIGQFREQGKTIVFVSHDLSIVNTLCDRVVLLNKGKMIVRGTPQDTIDFYLRQIGEDQGIHTFADDRMEIIFSHGRISAFVDGVEVSAAHGFRMHLQCMEQWQYSNAATWTIEDAGPTHCRARGRMARLPVALIWDMRIEKGKLLWRVALECEREVALQCIEINMFLPAGYARWQYGDLAGKFPELVPGDLNWHTVASTEVSCRDAMAFPGEGSNLPAAMLQYEAQASYMRLAWSNTDYVAGSRVLQVGGLVPESETPMTVGRHKLAALELDLQATSEAVAERLADLERARSVTAGALLARFDQGTIRLYDGDRELTSALSMYTSVLSGNMWNDSRNYLWGDVDCDGTRLAVIGRSRRFPFAQRWTLEAQPDGLVFRVEMEVFEPFDLQEQQTSVGLSTAYARWETDHESGEFAPFEAGREDWVHFNRDYAPGTRIHADSDSLPTVALELKGENPKLRMTPINSGFSQSTRVLQALHTSEAGIIRLDPGSYPYFSGIIRVLGK